MHHPTWICCKVLNSITPKSPKLYYHSVETQLPWFFLSISVPFASWPALPFFLFFHWAKCLINSTQTIWRDVDIKMTKFYSKSDMKQELYCSALPTSSNLNYLHLQKELQKVKLHKQGPYWYFKGESSWFPSTNNRSSELHHPQRDFISNHSTSVGYLL